MSNAQALAGKWTYRSFLNDPMQVLDYPHPNAKLRSLMFAEAVFTFADSRRHHTDGRHRLEVAAAST